VAAASALAVLVRPPGPRACDRAAGDAQATSARPTGNGSAGSAAQRLRSGPVVARDQMDRLLLDRGWNVDVAVGAVMGRWADIVGSNVAEHCKPVTFSDGVLTVRADSTAWTTQMRLMSSSILGRLRPRSARTPSVSYGCRVRVPRHGTGDPKVDRPRPSRHLRLTLATPG